MVYSEVAVQERKKQRKEKDRNKEKNQKKKLELMVNNARFKKKTVGIMNDTFHRSRHGSLDHARLLDIVCNFCEIAYKVLFKPIARSDTRCNVQ